MLRGRSLLPQHRNYEEAKGAGVEGVEQPHASKRVKVSESPEARSTQPLSWRLWGVFLGKGLVWGFAMSRDAESLLCTKLLLGGFKLFKTPNQPFGVKFQPTR